MQQYGDWRAVHAGEGRDREILEILKSQTLEEA